MSIDFLLNADSSTSSALKAVLASYALYLVSQVVYRLYLSPLAKFPGSRLAAATGWYETYYQLVKGGGGQFTFKIAEWHKKYGPIVRINPHEIHIHDPEYYEEVYANGQGIDKPDYVEYQFGTPGTVFGTVKHELHRQRKSVLLPFFSKRKVLEQVPQIQEHVDKISTRLEEEYAGSEKVLNLCNLFSCYTADVITKYSFDRTFDYLDSPDFMNPFTASFDGFKDMAHYSIQFPWLPKLLARLPESLIRSLQPTMTPVLDYQRAIRTQVEDIKQARGKGLGPRAKGTIFTEVMDSSLPPSEKTTARLSDEAAGVVGAGIETTKWAAVVTCFHIINNPPVLARLRRDLAIAFPDLGAMPSLVELEAVPYLMACIEEGLRLSYGSVARSPRIHRTKALQYGTYTIPAGTPVSCDAWHAHHDERVFASSFSFVPERWLDHPKGPDGKRNLSRYAMFFGKGTRMCLGLQLGYAELEMIVAMLFRRFELELYETGREDVDCYFDQITAGVKPGSQGVRIMVTKTLVHSYSD